MSMLRNQAIIVAIIGAVGAIVAAIIGALLKFLDKGYIGSGCPNNYYEYELKQGEQLRYIAKRNNYPLKDWKLILNPQDGKPYNSDKAQNLEVSDRVCLPNGWK
ncbi:MAG: hypothetical protein F6K22_25800 [Okeania sp. SIO2F4]|uniref:hypothetical protein n=1 Tax=Okeania sp. SIO2F4 TaxID=2607790 RepID=UPI001429CCD2|nr:hypothetical protein [Okeania sp. SIO2F4]NES05920.1 hypothetical protein [Okeania sp. SIO2F4]